MLPVGKVLCKDENQAEFRWKSWRTIYSLMFLFCGTVESCLGTRRLLRLGFNINFAEGLMFFIMAVVRGFIFFQLARNWKKIMAMWHKSEKVFLHEPYRVEGWSLTRKIRVVFIFMAFFAFRNFIFILLTLNSLEIWFCFSVEHILFMATAISDNNLQLTRCTPKTPIFWENFLARYRPHLRYHFPYSPFILPLYEVSF